ncbi:hypothetical protein ACOI1H_17660 [Loktanella sp. DJP18]|uniref:hypothetical protein n=1 Tax=Loktanella sp. DJP18 TaxID=3409788 RepID=UPI003BB6A675
MLPAKQETSEPLDAGHADIDVRPGSWWRLRDERHAFLSLPTPDHGLILMVSEVRVIDGDMHTIVLHPHPLWGSSRPKAGLKMMYEDFVVAFVLEPQGESFRETEIGIVMGQINAISNEMTTPPAPELLLEKQKKREAEKDAAKPASTSGQGTSMTAKDDTTPNLPATHAKVPAALLPSQDVVQAQKTIETRIAAFEAQKEWITGKTAELTSKMSLVSAYHIEKVNVTLASISEETTRAQGLLQNVQTMRLFLGEDMEVTQILGGAGAIASEPLRFMQRMLFLDEEIIINGLMEGFSDDQMSLETLTQVFSDDPSLVTRMLPYPRCAAIVRVRRNPRDFDTTSMSIAKLFETIAINEADQRVHIIVRDGARLSIVTADKTTSGAERFFPSSAEINALFQTRSYFGQESQEIAPDQVEYSDARAEHDKRALFYKRFLILMWGMHERTDVFGDFMPKGANWLAATTHTDHFRFIHDEEQVLTDGRPSITDFITNLNSKIVNGSRIVACWNKVLDGRNAPSLTTTSDYRRDWLTGIVMAESFSVVTAQAEGSSLIVKAPALRGTHRGNGTPFDAKVTIATPRELSAGRPDYIPHREIAEGLLCIDNCTLEDVTYYMNSRAARQSYLNHAHLLNEAFRILSSERAHDLTLLDTLRNDGAALHDDTFRAALRLWRAGNKWGWPETKAHRNAVLKVSDRLANRDDIISLLEGVERMIRGGIKSNGDVFALCDTADRRMPGGEALPWLTEVIITNFKTGKEARSSLKTWSERDEVGELTLTTWDDMREQFMSRVAPMIEADGWKDRRQQKISVRGWSTPRGLFDAANAKVVDTITASNVVEATRWLMEGESHEDLVKLLAQVYDGHKIQSGYVKKGRIRQSVALMHGITHESLPAAWVLDVEIDIDALAYHRGLVDEVGRRVRTRGLYGNPDRVLGKIKVRGEGLCIIVKRLSAGRPLTKVWKMEPCLSFDEDQDVLLAGHEIPKDDTRLSWKQVLASRITKADVKNGTGYMSSMSYSPDNLISASSSLKMVAPANADRFLTDIYDTCRKFNP